MITKEKVLEQVASHQNITAPKIARILGEDKADVRALLKEALDAGEVLYHSGYWSDIGQIATKDPSPFLRPTRKS